MSRSATGSQDSSRFSTVRNTIPIPHSATTLPRLCHYSATTLPYSSILCHYSTWLHETDGCDFHIGMCSMHIVASNIGVVAVYLTNQPGGTVYTPSRLVRPEGSRQAGACGCAAATAAEIGPPRSASRSQRDERAALVHSEAGRTGRVRPDLGPGGSGRGGALNVHRMVDARHHRMPRRHPRHDRRIHEVRPPLQATHTMQHPTMQHPTMQHPTMQHPNMQHATSAHAPAQDCCGCNALRDMRHAT